MKVPNLFNLIQDTNTKTIDSLELWLATRKHYHQTVYPAQDWTVVEMMAEVDRDCLSAWSKNHQSSNFINYIWRNALLLCSYNIIYSNPYEHLFISHFALTQQSSYYNYNSVLYYCLCQTVTLATLRILPCQSRNLIFFTSKLLSILHSSRLDILWTPPIIPDFHGFE